MELFSHFRESRHVRNYYAPLNWRALQLRTAAAFSTSVHSALPRFLLLLPPLCFHSKSSRARDIHIRFRAATSVVARSHLFFLLFYINNERRKKAPLG